MNVEHDILFSTLHSKLDDLKVEAKHLRRSSQVKHHESLDQVAVTFGCRDWQHLVYTAEKAYSAHLLRTSGEGFTDLEMDMLHSMDLGVLYQERPDIALLAIEERALELFKDIFETLRSPSLFAKRAGNFGDLPASIDDKNSPGWRFVVDVPSSFLFYGQYPADGKLVALIDGSVPYEAIVDHRDADPEADEEDLVAEIREHYRGNPGYCNIILDGHKGFGGGGGEVNVSLAGACYEAIRASIENQCGATSRERW